MWQLDVLAEEMDINELTWHFDVPFLREGDGVYNLKPKEVIEEPDSHKEEYSRTIKSDLRYPIDIMENKGHWLILDGLHRLMKAAMLDMKVVRVRKIPRSRIKEIEK